MSWFEVDRAGLRQLWGDKDKRFLLFELIANALDEPGVTYCRVSVKPIDGKRQVRIIVADDAPEGFVDLSHAYTLFAPTRKRANADVRGRFNVGEKHVLSLAVSGVIQTTTGMIEFGPGGRVMRRAKLERGSIIQIDVPMTLKEQAEMLRAARMIRPPSGVELTLNGLAIEYQRPLKKFSTVLATELAAEDGAMRRTRRKAEVRLYAVKPGERPMIFELGIPVMEIEDKWHIDVQQKIPLTIERDNVMPSFLRDVRAEVLNEMADKLSTDDAAEKWVRDGMSDERITQAAASTVNKKRWGDKYVVVAPGDDYSRERAVANGFHIVSGSELSRDEWDQQRRHGTIPSGGDLWERASVKSDRVPYSEQTEGMRRVTRLTRRVAKLVGIEVKVQIIKAPEATVSADYDRARHRLRFNMSLLGKAWFDGPVENVLRLIIHELGHEGGGHIEQGYYDKLCEIGAALAVASPRGFK